jgi:hypothetical protein
MTLVAQLESVASRVPIIVYIIVGCIIQYYFRRWRKGEAPVQAAAGSPASDALPSRKMPTPVEGDNRQVKEGNECLRNDLPEQAVRHFTTLIHRLRTKKDAGKLDAVEGEALVCALHNRAIAFHRMAWSEEAVRDCEDCMALLADGFGQNDSTNSISSSVRKMRAFVYHNMERHHDALGAYLDGLVPGGTMPGLSTVHAVAIDQDCLAGSLACLNTLMTPREVTAQDGERAARAMKDPEIVRILKDTKVAALLNDPNMSPRDMLMQSNFDLAVFIQVGRLWASGVLASKNRSEASESVVKLHL